MNLVRTDLCSHEGCNSDFAGVMYITLGFGLLDTISYPQLTGEVGNTAWWGTVPPGSYHKHICG